MDRMDIRDALASEPDEREITVAGWVRTLRTSKGGFSFIALNDGSCSQTLQIVADNTLGNYDDEIVHLTAGAAVAATGPLVESRGRGQRVEMQARAVRLLGPADPETYPIQPKRHSFEYLRTQAHLRPRTRTFAAVARVRNALSAAVHDFFQSRGFLWVHTPIITASDCEGAGALFGVTALDPDAPPRDASGHVDFAQDFFARRTYLTVSGQLEAEAYACAMGKVYTFGPTFRAENSNTPRHLAEFWMVEPEVAFCDLGEICDLAEQFCRAIISAVLDRCGDDLALFDERAPGLVDRLRHVADSDFARITYSEAVDILQAAGRRWDYPPRWGADLQTEHERYLTEEHFAQPVVVTHYPAAIKPFYMRLNDADRAGPGGEPTVAAMDVLLPGVGELIGGSQREERLDALAGRMREMGMNPDDSWWYLDLRRYGTCPHAGFGLGFERAVQFVTGLDNIRDAIGFPRTPRNAEF
ncbi:MAG: asparagine--tRNA ligase [Phycisphaerae bacterium]|nr:asparagine--tRNA ligase [Phycisphaerae bacterium]